MNRVLVCVTDPGDREMLFEYGNSLAKELGGKQEGLLLQSYEYEGGDVTEPDRDAIEAVYREALKYKATLKVVHTNNLARSLATYAEKNEIEHVVLPANHRGAIAHELKQQTEGRVKVHIVPEQEEDEK